jgi:DNA modification methylase
LSIRREKNVRRSPSDRDNTLELPIFDLPRIADTYAADERIILHTGDAHEYLRSLPSSTVALVVTSPPYNIGKEYEARVEMERYLRGQERVIEEVVRVLHEEGSLCWQVGNYVEHGEVYPLDVYYYPILKAHGLRLRNRVVWRFGHGLHASRRFSGRYETLLWFTKGDQYTFDLDAVRIPAKYPGKRHFKGPKRGRPSGNPLGKNPSDVWDLLVQEWEAGVWDIPNVKANHPEKTIHPCQFPVELVERCVLALTKEDDWVLDPYCGVGSALVAAVMHGRRAMGCDKEPSYTDIARERLQELVSRRLRTRALGTPIHRPSGRERVSQTPDEWRGGS